MFRGEIGPIQWVCITCSEYIFRDKATSLSCGFSPGFCPVEHTIQGWDGHHDHPMDPLVARRSLWHMGLHEVFWPNAKVFGRCTNWSATVLEFRTTYAPIYQIQNFLHPKIGLAINCPTTNTTVKPRDQASSFWGARAANHGGFQGQGQYRCASLAPITRISICTPKVNFWGTEACSLWAWDLSIDRLSHAGRLYTWEKVLGRKESSGLLFFQRRASRRNLMLGGRARRGRLVRQSWRVGGMSFCHVAQGSVGWSFLERLPWRNGCWRRKIWGGCCQVELGEVWEWSFVLFGDCIQDWLGSGFCGTAIETSVLLESSAEGGLARELFVARTLGVFLLRLLQCHCPFSQKIEGVITEL